MNKRIVIPARYASSRLPGKMLLDIAGKPMLQHVIELAQRCDFDSVLVATDDQRIVDLCESLAVAVCMTNVNHETGTDRIAEAFALMGYDSDDVIVGLQGDEPFLPVANIQQLADNCIAHPEADMATLCERLHTIEDVVDPNAVKLVMDKNGYVLYFSRAPIPWGRDYFPTDLPKTMSPMLHLGVYCYRGRFLQRYQELEHSALESWEGLEQLRVLWHGGRIHAETAREHAPAGVDTPAGLERARARCHAGT